MAFTPSHANMVNAAAGTTSMTDTAFTAKAGDLVVVKSCSENFSDVVAAPTAAGLTFSVLTTDATSGHCHVRFSYAAVPADGTYTVSATCSSAGKKSMCVECWPGSTQGGLANNFDARGTGAPSTNLTPQQSGSCISWVIGDFAAVNPATVAYIGATTQTGLDDQHVAGAYVGYYAYTIGNDKSVATSLGETAPTGQTWTFVGLEVQAVAAKNNGVVNVNKAAMQRAATY